MLAFVSTDCSRTILATSVPVKKNGPSVMLTCILTSSHWVPWVTVSSLSLLSTVAQFASSV